MNENFEAFAREYWEQGIWVTKERELIPVSELPDNRLIACVNFMRNKAYRKLIYWNEGEDTLVDMYGEDWRNEWKIAKWSAEILFEETIFIYLWLEMFEVRGIVLHAPFWEHFIQEYTDWYSHKFRESNA